MILFQTVVALAEALSIARANGVDGKILFETLTKGSADSFALRNHGMKAMLPGVFPERAFSTDYALKDLSYAIQMAEENGVPALGADVARELMERAGTRPWQGILAGPDQGDREDARTCNYDRWRRGCDDGLWTVGLGGSESPAHSPCAHAEGGQPVPPVVAHRSAAAWCQSADIALDRAQSPTPSRDTSVNRLAARSTRSRSHRLLVVVVHPLHPTRGAAHAVHDAAQRDEDGAWLKCEERL